jgi:valyl-tRNA synthetase
MTVSRKLDNKKFLINAPPLVVDKEKDKKKQIDKSLSSLQSQLIQLDKI